MGADQLGRGHRLHCPRGRAHLRRVRPCGRHRHQGLGRGQDSPPARRPHLPFRYELHRNLRLQHRSARASLPGSGRAERPLRQQERRHHRDHGRQPRLVLGRLHHEQLQRGPRCRRAVRLRRALLQRHGSVLRGPLGAGAARHRYGLHAGRVLRDDRAGRGGLRLPEHLLRRLRRRSHARRRHPAGELPRLPGGRLRRHPEDGRMGQRHLRNSRRGHPLVRRDRR